MKLWPMPQISLHWPKNVPQRVINKPTSFKRPGQASILIPKDGTAQLWITSLEVTNNRICVWAGNVKKIFVCNKRNSPEYKSSVNIESNLKECFKKSLNS